jgi:membrane protein implicated in regulation of membrane protease activity
MVLGVIACSVRQYIASLHSTPAPRLWFQIGESRRIPPWDWALQITVFAIAAVILLWLFVPTSRQAPASQL